MHRRFFVVLFASLLITACADSTAFSGDHQPNASVGQAMDQAGDGYDPMNCSSIKVKGNRERCKTDVENAVSDATLREALATFDLSLCDGLPEVMSMSCKSEIEKAGVRGPISPADAEALQVALSPSYDDGEGQEAPLISIVPIYDVSACSNLNASSGLQAYCQQRIERLQFEAGLNALIINGNGKASDCAQFDEEFVVECESRFDFSAPKPLEPLEPTPIPSPAEGNLPPDDGTNPIQQ